MTQLYTLTQGNNRRLSEAVTPAELLPTIFDTLIEQQPEGTLVVRKGLNDSTLKVYETRRKGITVPLINLEEFENILRICDQRPESPEKEYDLTFPSQTQEGQLDNLSFQKAQILPLIEIILKTRDYKGPLPTYSLYVRPRQIRDN